jgi:PEGA domain
LTATLLVGLIAGAGIGVTVGDRLPFPVPFRSSAADADGAGPAPDAAGRGYTDAALPTASDPPPAPATPKEPSEREPADSARASRDVTSTVELGRLLVRSSPSGAEVLVNGIRRGMTPVAVRDLPLGTHTVVLTRPGYDRAEHRITLTETRPSRSLEARLLTPAAEPSPSAIVDPPTRVDEARAATGSLLVETRPAGARAIVNGRDAGTTPLTLESLAPGVYTVRFEREGYQPWETSVRIDAGARARVAASLVGGGQPE